ncbi:MULTISPECIES: cobalamin biosynthesis protein CbiG [unclassified Brevundimonas]|uniref:cobalamin biosynthesis protein CbiG n=1 Tax=unclassified Brevundimonas TaxID=2622653 RepID=UPI0025C67A96|nr:MULTISPECIES: cobalamin biosynthesis protein CbiG [unclassified Brevundimonas]
MARLFDAYIIAKWTAAEGKKLGEQTLWIGVAKRDVRFRLYTETHNVATRAEGEAMLENLLAEHRKRGDRVLLGLDFDFGFPAGTSALLKLEGRPWDAMGKFLTSNVVDKADNTNNRYQVAAKMNRLMTDQPWPFWGAPASQAQRWLTTTKPPEGSGDNIPEFRATEQAARQMKLPAHSVWQMHGAGAIGGLTLVGVPMLRRLLAKLDTSAALWPFGTGWRELGEDDLSGISTLIVEVWPALFKATRQINAEGIKEYKTQSEVRAAAEAIATMDDEGRLQKAFAPPSGTSAEVIDKVENEEGWILGVG